MANASQRNNPDGFASHACMFRQHCAAEARLQGHPTRAGELQAPPAAATFRPLSRVLAKAPVRNSALRLLSLLRSCSAPVAHVADFQAARDHRGPVSEHPAPVCPIAAAAERRACGLAALLPGTASRNCPKGRSEQADQRCWSILLTRIGAVEAQRKRRTSHTGASRGWRPLDAYIVSLALPRPATAEPFRTISPAPQPDGRSC